MCGIIGGLGEGCADVIGVNLELLQRRGPDDSGLLNFSNGLTMGATRLAMTDPHERSNQPMVDLLSGNAIVFNGEVYNFKEIRKQLINKKVMFNTESDTEVVLKALTTFGEKIISNFEGMFAFAFYDKKNNNLVMARDYLGKKPLYYYIGEQKLFFASQVRVIKNCIKSLEINLDAINTYLHLGYLIDPESMFKNVFSVKPGEVLTLDLDTGTVLNKTEFIPKQIIQPDTFSIQSSLALAISERVEGHDKFALSLSGGIDSTLIALESKRLGLNVNAYTLSWGTADKSKYNLDALQSSLISKELNLNHQIIDMPPAYEIPAIINQFVSAMDQPNSNSTGVSMMHLYSKIAVDGHRLVVTGDGSDEVFGGYHRYELINKFRHFPKLDVQFLKKAITKSNQKSINLRRFSAMATPTNFPESWLYWHLLCTDHMVGKIWRYENKLNVSLYGDELSNIYGNDNKNASNIMFKDLRTWLSMESNRRLDCVSMWHSIEARSPFQSERVIGQGYNKMKSTNFSKIKKEILFDEFPQLKKLSILNEKVGFVSPVGYWLRNNKELVNYSVENIVKSLPFNRNELDKLVRAPENYDFYRIKILWSLVILNNWIVDNN